MKTPTKEDFYTQCHVGHHDHAKKLVDVRLSGFNKIKDMPPVPRHLRTNLQMMVYDWKQYFQTIDGNETMPKYEDYCTGQDIISYCIDRQGIWEAYETLLVLDILHEGEPLTSEVFDFGSHVGWYSLLAAKKGYRTNAFDASEENLFLLRESSELNNLTQEIGANLCWLDKDVKPLNAATALDVQLLKCDIEGAEVFCYQFMQDYFKRKKINYAIFEISPTFNDSYTKLMQDICNHGYDVYQIPGKGYAFEDEFSKQPLETITKYNKIIYKDIPKTVKRWSQENVLFVRRDND